MKFYYEVSVEKKVIIKKLKEALGKTADSSKIVAVKRIIKELEEKDGN